MLRPRVFSVSSYHDDRGCYSVVHERYNMLQEGITDTWVQDAYVRSRHGVVRGLHYQLPPCEQSKLVIVLRGEIFDVAVDLRRVSPAYGRAMWVTLSDKIPEAFFVPAGCAHGFMTVSGSSDVLYKVSAPYEPGLARAIRWNDPRLGIPWPLKKAILSETDATAPVWEKAELPWPD